MKKLLILLLLLIFTADSYAQVSGGNKMKKAVMVIAQENFRDEELFEPKEVLEKSGIEVKIASSGLKLAKGMLGGTAEPEFLLKDINARDFDAVIFVGGAGASVYWDDPVAHRLIKEAYNSDKIVGAICIAPVTLAKAGILKGKKATVWKSESGQLKAAGAIYTGVNCQKDGKIITAAGPFAAKEFGEELVRAILY
jgi:protease I